MEQQNKWCWWCLFYDSYTHRFCCTKQRLDDTIHIFSIHHWFFDICDLQKIFHGDTTSLFFVWYLWSFCCFRFGSEKVTCNRRKNLKIKWFINVYSYQRRNLDVSSFSLNISCTVIELFHENTNWYTVLTHSRSERWFWWCISRYCVYNKLLWYLFWGHGRYYLQYKWISKRSNIRIDVLR